MAYSKFKTKNANYIARYGSHRPSKITPERIFNDPAGSIDAIILEIRGSVILKAGSLRSAIEQILKGKLQKEDFNLIKYAKKHNIPIYIVEPEVTKRDRSKFWIDLWSAPIILPVISRYIYSTEDKEVSSRTKKLFYRYDKHIRQIYTAGKNAVWAEKIEKFVAKQLRDKLKRKPIIGLNIGIGHIGLEHNLKDPNLRTSILKKLKDISIQKYSLFNYGLNFGQVYEAIPSKSSKWDIIEIDPGLFKLKIPSMRQVSTLIIILGGLLSVFNYTSITGFLISQESISIPFTIGISMFLVGILLNLISKLKKK